jgi:hypothetical protein
MHFNFIASDHFDLKSLNTVESFVDDFKDFQTVWLNDENELNSLFNIMGLPEINGFDLNSTVFSRYWDLSSFKLPELDSEQFDKFYDDWIQSTGRDHNMNEYGSLIFLQGLSPKWNKLKYRLVVKETSNGQQHIRPAVLSVL